MPVVGTPRGGRGAGASLVLPALPGSRQAHGTAIPVVHVEDGVQDAEELQRQRALLRRLRGKALTCSFLIYTLAVYA